MTSYNVAELEKLSNQIRQDIINTVALAGSGHQGGPLGMTDIFVALYFVVAKINPKDPWNADRDRVYLSNGHICPVWYPTLAHRGFFPHKELKTLRQLNSRLQGHPHRQSAPGVENTGGPLGQGLSQAIGVALGGKMDGKKFRVFALLSDAELQEGQNWEALMFAGNNKLDNLVAVVDFNNMQIDGDVSDVMPIEPLVDKFKAFNWHVVEIDGHNFDDIINGLREAESIHDLPTVIVAHTTPGKGVSFMENSFYWHSHPFKEGEAQASIKDLLNFGGKKWLRHEL